MGAFDFDGAVRWGRLDPGHTLSRRDDKVLPFIGDHPGAGHGLLLDTCIYIDGLQGRSPDSVGELLSVRIANHSTVAIQELMHTVGVLDPADPRTKGVVKQIGVLFAAMPAHRTFTPDADVLARAALLSGMLCRLQGYQKDARLRALHDCVLFLQAQKLGFAILTANIADFDYMLQLVPAGRVLFYRRS
ncbi:type II toxin-antitoxin system VapC family toxin [Chelatococcus asaccharovorans]|uniref:type II toxin-antitoxin system VapC family toxin n=1 Tax=Chelatococcus asaccharovorans TaxID=28210 RepID=UPI00224C65C7|nr:DNA-binding protein [Chelatococcus asaccharovorans]CAH1658269.1 DNA-binding protein [Chelatococcus asaccharovorans]CAH1688759.1 DNA-binding protein [Chelatococcus asaccharovorans]